MRIEIKPTHHDSDYLNGESPDGQKDWLLLPSSSVEFTPDEHDNVFKRVAGLLEQVRWGKKKIEGELEEFYQEVDSFFYRETN